MSEPQAAVNPAPGREPYLETAIMEGGPHDRSIALALEASTFFEIPRDEARRMITMIADTIAAQWREMFRQVGVTGERARDYETAFEHEESKRARAL
jgi:serine/threonine-protein kinase HipA